MTNTNHSIVQDANLNPSHFSITEHLDQHVQGAPFYVTCIVRDEDGDFTWGHFPTEDEARAFVFRVTSTAPTAAGQLVQDSRGRQGITTDAPRKTTPRIAVQFIGAPYDVLVPVSELTVVTTISTGA